jgi:hypothetical protein
MALDKLKSSALDTNIAVTGDLTVDTNTIYVDSTNNRVGIGTSSPQRHLHINDPSAVSTKIQITNSATGSGSDGEGFQLSIGSSGQAAIEQRENQPLTFSTNNTERLRILSSGGITFNGDTATANALDDYEEGTWTSVPIVGTYSFNSPRYTKIGRMVHCHAQIGTISDNSSSQSLRIQLPFAAVSNDTAVSFGTLYVNVGRNPIVGGYLSGTTDLILYVNNTFSQLFHSDTSSGTSIYAAWSYMAAS